MSVLQGSQPIRQLHVYLPKGDPDGFVLAVVAASEKDFVQYRSEIEDLLGSFRGSR